MGTESQFSHVPRAPLTSDAQASDEAPHARVVTHPRIFRVPTPLGVALEFIENLRASPATVPVLPGERHWQIFTDLCTRLDAKGNKVPDAFLAAIAIEQGATWISADRAFAGFPGLRWEHPLDD